MADETDFLHRAEERAEQALADPRRIERIAARARQRAGAYRERLGDSFDEIQSIIRLLSAWARGRYRVVPLRTLVALTAALLYFLMPLDAVPDFILALGLLDDMAIIARVLQVFRQDLAAFRAWEGSQDPNSANEDNNNAT